MTTARRTEARGTEARGTQNVGVPPRGRPGANIAMLSDETTSGPGSSQTKKRVRSREQPTDRTKEAPWVDPRSTIRERVEVDGLPLELIRIGRIYFETNSAKLGEQELAALDRLKSDYRGRLGPPNRKVPLFYFVGHADYRGPENRNHDLAERRAKRVDVLFCRGMRILRSTYTRVISIGERESAHPPLRGRVLSDDRRVDIYTHSERLTNPRRFEKITVPEQEVYLRITWVHTDDDNKRSFEGIIPGAAKWRKGVLRTKSIEKREENFHQSICTHYGLEFWCLDPLCFTKLQLHYVVISHRYDRETHPRGWILPKSWRQAFNLYESFPALEKTPPRWARNRAYRRKWRKGV